MLLLVIKRENVFTQGHRANFLVNKRKHKLKGYKGFQCNFCQKRVIKLFFYHITSKHKAGKRICYSSLQLFSLTERHLEKRGSFYQFNFFFFPGEGKNTYSRQGCCLYLQILQDSVMKLN